MNEEWSSDEEDALLAPDASASTLRSALRRAETLVARTARQLLDDDADATVASRLERRAARRTAAATLAALAETAAACTRRAARAGDVMTWRAAAAVAAALGDAAALRGAMLARLDDDKIDSDELELVRIAWDELPLLPPHLEFSLLQQLEFLEGTDEEEQQNKSKDNDGERKTTPSKAKSLWH